MKAFLYRDYAPLNENLSFKSLQEVKDQRPSMHMIKVHQYIQETLQKRSCRRASEKL